MYIVRMRISLHRCYCLLMVGCLRINRVIEMLKGKEVVMRLVSHVNSEVRMQALLAIQKMMVQNW